ncbi:hypothetical protein HMPREF1624_05065 [Sporothrix schenckii ATCC 58251]|uniref:Xylanolytic transcriptional activator regulatory domain-containing protein n=1 Tax=Sporothrix schenckii (strain ATCC 58251 / de Perez 2211183) TaxID=1391915 RepID=U7PTJ7_SPOS1|nr:hypothetical protein HMPREF1624_05065 [Sporothrix schenckii ATCC 58251]
MTGTACVYKERGQPGLRPGYGRAVEGRLSLLEENVEKMAQSIHNVLQHVQAQSVRSGQVPSVDMGSVAPSNNSEDAQQLAQQLGQTPTQLNGPASYNPPLPPSQQPLPLLEPPLDPTLPPRAVLDELVDLFFTHVYPWAPLFHRPTFQATMLLPDRQLLLHGMVVLGFRFWTTTRDEQGGGVWPSAAAREQYVKVSRDRLLVDTINSASLVAYQALALLAIDAMGDGPGPRTWNMMAMLVACARQLHLDHNPSPITGVMGVGVGVGMGLGMNANMGLGGGGMDSASGSVRATSPSSPLVTNDDTEESAATANTLLGVASSAPSSSSSAVEAEEKRRLFWTIYNLDRFSSVSLGQPCAIDRRRLRVQYPARDDAWGQRVPLAWFGTKTGTSPSTTPYGVAGTAGPPPTLWQCFIDILSLVDQSNQLLVQPTNLSLPAQCQEWQSKFRRIDILSRTWRENLPPDVRTPPSPAAPSASTTIPFDPMWYLVHATYALIHIRMYTVASFPATASPYMRPSSSARAQLRQAVDQVAGLATGLQPAQVGQLGPLFAFVVWVAARSLIILWTTGNTADGVADATTATASSPFAPPPHLTTLVAVLHQSARYWPCAQCYVDILQLILDTKNNPGGPTGLAIFNDTRRTAYGLRRRLGSLASLRGRGQSGMTQERDQAHNWDRDRDRGLDVERDHDLFGAATDDFFDGVFAGLIEIPPAGTPQQLGSGFGFGFVNPSPDFDRDWL